MKFKKEKEKKKTPKQKKIVIIPTPKPFDQLQSFFEEKKDQTAMDCVSKLNPEDGIPEVLSRDLLRVFRKTNNITNEDLCYFVERVLNCTKTNKDSGKENISLAHQYFCNIVKPFIVRVMVNKFFLSLRCL
jgi:hypothetical protein